MSEYQPPLPDSDLATQFAQRRRGITDPARLVAAELENISQALLEVLKQLRLARSHTRQ